MLEISRYLKLYYDHDADGWHWYRVNDGEVSILYSTREDAKRALAYGIIWEYNPALSHEIEQYFDMLASIKEVK